MSIEDKIGQKYRLSLWTFNYVYLETPVTQCNWQSFRNDAVVCEKYLSKTSPFTDKNILEKKIRKIVYKLAAKTIKTL